MAAIAVVTTLGVAGCTQGAGQEESPPRGVVVNLGGRVSILDDINAHPDVVADRPEGTERLDVYRLTAPKQLADGLIVGILDGAVVAIDPKTPDQQVVLGPATSWFAAADGSGVWAVTEDPTSSACAGQPIAESGRSRFSVSKFPVSGRPAQTTYTLPCGLRPFAETSRGIAALQVTDAGSNREHTDLVLLNADATAVRQTLAKDSSSLASEGGRLLWKESSCDSTDCIKVYDSKAMKTVTAPECAEGTIVGRGTLDATGRWYASAIATDSGFRLAVLDLDRGSCKDLGANAVLDGDQDLDGALSGTWAQANLLVLDSTTGALTSFNAVSGKQVERKQSLDVSGLAQVWGARTE
ncbi:hypothetical protein [Streptomyces exfoliatus]|uniref:hypothetical protein n=1 Tax=Streptomyces exfoliatus TaxID=1905 RepID=UPI000465B193|nr:hypothetical protein [Streptomyces exfoliatus]